MTPDEIRDLIERYFAAVNSRDWEAFASTLHPQVTIQQGARIGATGIESVTRLYQAIVRQYVEHHHEDRPVRVLVDGRSAAVEIAFEGQLLDGTRLGFPAFDVIDVEDGAIRRVSTWYDTAVVVPMITGE